MNEKLAAQYEAVNSQWVGQVLTVNEDGKWTCMTVTDGLPTEEAVVEVLRSEWSDHRLVDHQAFTEAWRQQFAVKVGPKARLFVSNPSPGRGRTDSPKQDKRRVVKQEVPTDVNDSTWVAPVQAAKWVGVPPQYLYQVISKGRLKTQGERPKKVLWGEVKKYYGILS